MTDYHERLAQALRKKGLQQKDLAEELGISQPSLSRILSGKQYLDFHLAVKASEFLGVSLSWLAYGRESDPELPRYYQDPGRQRIEYLLSLLQKKEYPLVIRTMENIIELRIKKSPAEAVPQKSPQKAPDEAAEKNEGFAPTPKHRKNQKNSKK